MAALFDFDTLKNAFLRSARATPDARAWLTAKHAAALEAVLAGDEFIKSTSNPDGGGAMAERGVPATTILQLCEACLQVLDAEAAAAADGMPGAARGGATIGDFSEMPTNLG